VKIDNNSKSQTERWWLSYGGRRRRFSFKFKSGELAMVVGVEQVFMHWSLCMFMGLKAK
jgi:hypothetical protein